VTINGKVIFANTHDAPTIVTATVFAKEGFASATLAIQAWIVL
jgi:hypothetical protein